MNEVTIDTYVGSASDGRDASARLVQETAHLCGVAFEPLVLRYDKSGCPVYATPNCNNSGIASQPVYTPAYQ